jgi:hypothetical protein
VKIYVNGVGYVLHESVVVLTYRRIVSLSGVRRAWWRLWQRPRVLQLLADEAIDFPPHAWVFVKNGMGFEVRP